MTLPFALRATARADIDAAYLFYERLQAGLGDRFVAALNRLLAQVCQSPYLYGRVRGNVRAGPVKPFAFVAYYRVEPTRVLVIAVLHGRAHPRRMRRRR